MDVQNPEQVIQLFSRRLGEGDLDGAIALYEPEAAFIQQPGSVVTGVDAIREALAGFVALRPTLEGSIASTVTAGDVALVINDWTLRGTQPDGTPVELSGRSHDVLRRSADGGWLISIDNPWGDAGS